MKADLYTEEGKKKGELELPESVFGVSWNQSLASQVIRALEANKRRGAAHSKDRSEVRGGGRKPWRQKGTGRARHGSIRSPIWRGGGVTFGPRNERDYSQKINKKMRTKALAALLSRKHKDGGIMFVSEISIDSPKTALAKDILKSLSKIKGFEEILSKKNNSVLLILNSPEEVIKKSFRNFSNLEAVDVKDLNALDVIKYKKIVIANAKDAIEVLEGRIGKKKDKEDKKQANRVAAKSKKTAPKKATKKDVKKSPAPKKKKSPAKSNKKTNEASEAKS